MTKRMPLVSVIMPVYNGARFVGKAIESIVNQTYPRVELIVCDDGSTDNTWHILKEYRKRFPKIVRIYRLKKNHGESTAANLAFAKTQGEYIARLDADDIAHRFRLDRQVGYMQSHPRVIALGTQARVINAKGQTIGHKRTPLTQDTIHTAFAYYNPMVHPSIMFRRSLLPKRDYLYRSNFETTDDYHTYFELLNYGQFANLEDELVSYRIHGANKSLSNMKEKFWTDTKVRMAAISHMGYQAPILMFPAIIIQAIIVTVVPEKWLHELFYYIRGIKKISFTSRFPELKKFQFRESVMEKLKTYATTFLS